MQRKTLKKNKKAFFIFLSLKVGVWSPKGSEGQISTVSEVHRIKVNYVACLANFGNYENVKSFKETINEDKLLVG